MGCSASQRRKRHITFAGPSVQPWAIKSRRRAIWWPCFLFLETDDFWQDYNAYVEKGIEFARPPVEAEYGTVAVFKYCQSNLWDLIQYNKSKSA